MFRLKTTDLRLSKVGVVLWIWIVLLYAALLQLYWMPAYLRAFLFLSIGTVGFLLLMHSIFKARCNSRPKIGIDEQGAFLFKNGQYERLLFVRANGIQLIATTLKQKSFLGQLFPTYKVIFFDSLSKVEYSTLRSFAAQQILLSRSEETKKRFE